MTDKQIKNKYRKLVTLDVDVRVGDGWDNIVDSALTTIATYCMTKPALNCKVNTIKEKFGALRIYHNANDSYINGVVNMANAISEKTCELCGNPGELYKDGCARVRCDLCKEAEL